MGKILVVAEKPSVGRDLARVLSSRKKEDGYIDGSGIILFILNFRDILV